ncbi:putative RNA polymerase II subunit B1 CTD phosphatase RPAP2 isoform X2 [Anabrus simplex]|uniref:putative RNA polymerase II subunit B1 CTD phosphatase RPAP2 isoform X2 n=1 Tax=Anabrus simplex TaxID=316456 RepID=UPI0035A390DB
MGEVNHTMRNRKHVQREGLPRRIKDMSKEQLEAALRKKKECNTRALIIVERLLENSVSEDWFLESNFCSNQCYKAGKYIKDQLLTSPLWLRDKEEIPVFRVLPVGSTGTGAGEEVDIGQNNNSLKEEVAQLEDDGFTSVAHFALNSLSKLSKKIDKLEKKEPIKHSDENKIDHSNKEKKSVRFEDEVKHFDSIKTDSIKPELTCMVGKNSTSSKDISSNDIRVSEHKSTSLETHKVMTKATTALESRDGKEGEHTEEKITYKIGNMCEDAKKVLGDTSNVSVGDRSENDSSQMTNKTNLHEIEKDVTKSVPHKTEKKLQTREKGISKRSSKSREKKKQPDIPPVTNSIIHIEKCLHEWFTLDSMCFLFGEEKVKEMVVDKGECISEYYKAVGSTTRDAAMREKYEAICRRLNLIELEDNKFDADARQLKPLPDYRAITEESKKMEIKVKAFYQGKTDFETPKENQPQVEEEEPPSAVLPLVDLHAQNALRRRIVLDRLNRILPDLLRTFGLSSRDITTDLRALFCTFTLAAHNITFKPAEWSLLGLVIIKMLTIRDMRLKMMLDTDQASKYQTMMLMAFNQDGGYLERLMVWLTDIDNILQKQPLSNRPEETNKPLTV